LDEWLNDYIKHWSGGAHNKAFINQWLNDVSLIPPFHAEPSDAPSRNPVHACMSFSSHPHATHLRPQRIFREPG
jgi:hypothetical protein